MDDSETNIPDAGPTVDQDQAAVGSDPKKKKNRRKKRKTSTKDNETEGSNQEEVDQGEHIGASTRGQKSSEKPKEKGKQNRGQTGKGQHQQKTKAMGFPLGQHSTHNHASSSQTAQYDAHFSPQPNDQQLMNHEQFVQFGAGQRSPYQKFLQKCGGNLEELGYGATSASSQINAGAGFAAYRGNNSPNKARDSHRERGQQHTPGQRKVQQQRQPWTNQQQYQQQNPRQDNTAPFKPDNRRVSQGQNNRRRRQVFEPYLSDEDVSHGLKRGEIIQGALRINPRNYEDCYVPHPDGVSDVYICGMKDRNRALNGDVVAVMLYPREQWKVLMDDFESNPRVSRNLSEMMGNQSTRVAPDSSQVTKGLENLNLGAKDKTATMSPSKGADNSVTKTPSKGSQPAPGRGSQSGKTPNKRFVSLRQLCTSPDSQPLDNVKRDLFKDGQNGIENAEEGEIAKRMEVIPNKLLLRTGQIVAIIEKKHSRASTGHIRVMQDRNPNQALFVSKDHRFPRVFVPMEDCPKDFLERSDDHKGTLFIARLTEWADDSQYPKGRLARSLGEAGEVEPETEGMLIENGVDFAEFTQEVLDCLPKDLPWTIPQKEFEYRKDLRKECIFTIDPATARDLDDALHCTKLEDGNYEIGVHIADVSFFIDEYSALDKSAASRATSVYLIQKVIPMLPRLLCEQLCSLNPDEDRLAFSVIWKMTEQGEIYDEWFGRSVICSCAKLSYAHAQGFLEEPDRVWKAEELPPISEGFTIPMIVERVLNLNKVAKNMRKKRYDGGALRLDQVKLSFALDKDSGLPCGYSVYQQKDSNRLIEEFMLLANMAVSHKIYKTYPEISMLRRHPPPQTKQMDELIELCKSLGIQLDASSAGALQQSLARYTGNELSDRSRVQILTVMASKPMQNAKYFCTGCIDDEEVFRHYALNVPLYTHFTSPIRRYPDVVVHRLLAAAIGLCDPPSREKGEVQSQAEHCNDKKLASKRVQELSSELFFAIFVKECGPLEEKGMVMGVLDKSFDVLVLSLGVVKRIYCEQLPLASFDFRKDHKRPELTMVWKESENHKAPFRQVLTIFTEVNCVLEMDPDAGPLKWKALMKHPEEEISSS